MTPESQIARNLRAAWRACAALLGFGASLALFAAEPSRPAVAITTVVTQDRAPAAGGVITDLLTARLSADARWQLVERARLADLEQELSLSAGGWTDAANAVHQGRLTRADLVLICRLRSVDDTRGEAEIQLIDALRAERLATAIVPFAERPAGAWLRSPPAADATAIVVAAERALAAAVARLDSLRAKPVVAPLFVRLNVRNPRLAPLPARLIEVLQSATEQNGARFLMVQSNEAVLEEGLLANTGLTDFTAEAWQKVADLYLWGEITTRPQQLANGDLALQLRLSTWGADKPEVHVIDGTLGRFDELAQEAARHVAADLARRGPQTAEMRRQVADRLMAEAQKQNLDHWIAQPKSPPVTAGLAAGWRYVDAAAFFAPEDAQIQELRLMIWQRLAESEAVYAQIRAEYRRLARAFWRRPDRTLDLGLLDRTFKSWSPHEPDTFDLIREIGPVLRDAAPDDLAPWKDLFNTWMQVVTRTTQPGESLDKKTSKTAFEAIWPMVRSVLPWEFAEGASPSAQFTYGYKFSIRQLYEDEPAKRESFLSPPSAPSAAAPNARPRIVASAAPNFGRWTPPAPTGMRVTVSNSAPPGYAEATLSDQELAKLRQATPEERNARLLSACYGSQPAIAVQLLALGADPLWSPPRNNSALTYSINTDKWALVEAMIAAKPDFSRPAAPGTPPGQTAGAQALHQVLEKKRPDLARKLLEAGARPAAVPTSGSASVVGVALQAGDFALARDLVKLGARPRSADHPLHWAVGAKHAEALAFFLDAMRQAASGTPADASAWGNAVELEDIDADGRTALLHAVITRWPDGVAALVAAGANLEVNVPRGRHLWHYASEAPEIAVLVNRRPPDAPDNQLGGARAVAAILRKDPAVDAWPIDPAVLRYRDSKGWTVLHYACENGRDLLARRLVTAGASLTATTLLGVAPLTNAAANCDAALVAAMLQAGAPVNLAAERGASPLHGAATRGDPETLRLLLKAGADPNRRAYPSGETPLLTAARRPTAKVALATLFEAGIPADSEDAAGYGVLEYAVASNDPAAIQLLLDRGVRWRQPWPDRDYHPLVAAVRGGSTRSVQKLLELGLRDDRALAFAADTTIRALLEDDARARGSRVANDAELWPSICADERNAVARARAHLTAGGNVNFRHQLWTPLSLAVKALNVELVKLLIDQGADPGLEPQDTSEVALGGIPENRGRSLSVAPARNDEVTAAIVRIVVPKKDVPDHYPPILYYVAVSGMQRTVDAMLECGVSSDWAVAKIMETPHYTPETRTELLRRLHRSPK